MDFLLMIEGERQWFDPLRQSNLYLQKKNGKVVICKKENWSAACKREQSFGHCQVHSYYHPEITNDKRFEDSYWQLDQCWNLYKGGTKFYGIANKHNSIKKFK